MFRVTIRGLEVTCESTEEIVALVLAASTPEPKPTTRPTTRATTDKKKKPTKKLTKKATLKARAAQARASYKAKQEASRQAHRQEVAEAEAVSTAETHHGGFRTAAEIADLKQRKVQHPKRHRADTGADVIAVLRRSGLALTTDEVYGDLQKAGWKYKGDQPLPAVRGCLNRLVKTGTVTRDTRNGDIIFRIARVEHADPLPHQQRETDV